MGGADAERDVHVLGQARTAVQEDSVPTYDHERHLTLLQTPGEPSEQRSEVRHPGGAR